MLALDSGHTVGDIAAPLQIRCDRFVGLQSMIGQGFQVFPQLPHSAIHASNTGFHSPFPHDPRNPVLADNQPLSTQSLVDPWTAIAAFAVVVDSSNLQQ